MHVMSSAFIASVMHPDVSRDLPSCAPRTRMRVADEADGADTKLMASDDEREAMGEKDKVRERERARQREAKEARQALLKRGLKGHPEMDRKLTQNQQGDSWCSWLSPSNWSSPTWLLKPCLELFFAGSGQSDHIHSARALKRSDEAVSLVHETIEAEIRRHRRDVELNKARVEAAFAAVARLPPVDVATRRGSDADAAARERMWQLLSHQVEAGFGGPTQAQLEALWLKYDSNCDGQLSSRELQRMLADHAHAMLFDLRREVGAMRRAAEAEAAANPFAAVILRALIATQQAQLSLFEAQASGSMSEEQIRSVFSALDADGDGSVTRDEFLANATDAFFALTLQTLHLLSGVEALDTHADAQADTHADAHGDTHAVTDGGKHGEVDTAALVEQGVHVLLEQKRQVRESLRAQVRKSQAEIQVSLEMAGSASSDEQRAARHRMWKLLSRQLIGGLGAPREAQLSALWSRYDADHNGCLSKGELGMMMADYAAARADELEAEELPSLQRMMEEHDDNPFVRSLAEARLLSKRAELELYRAQSHGALPAAAVEAAFKQLDTRHDGRVFRDDFLAHATDVFFGIQMERLQAMKDLESADVAAAQQGGAAGELEEPKGR